LDINFFGVSNTKRMLIAQCPKCRNIDIEIVDDVRYSCKSCGWTGDRLQFTSMSVIVRDEQRLPE